MVIDVGLGNIKSILKMYAYLGIKVCAINEIKDFDPNAKLILPGVGKFDQGVRLLQESGFFRVLQNDNLKILGICLGMQLLCRQSEEGCLLGLGLIPGEVKKFNKISKSMKIPHMGWNSVTVTKDNPLIPLGSVDRFYFVHSYHCVCDKDDNIIFNTKYGNSFASGICSGNIYGVQFHPEKSHKFGIQLLKNFAEL
jgi:glutamine amidotransferase